jgi:hypothetical protein
MVTEGSSAAQVYGRLQPRAASPSVFAQLTLDCADPVQSRRLPSRRHHLRARRRPIQLSRKTSVRSALGIGARASRAVTTHTSDRPALAALVTRAFHAPYARGGRSQRRSSSRA